MKTARELIKSIRIWEPNIRQIADSGDINGSLLIDIETVMQEYATEAIKSDRERVSAEVYEKYNGSYECKQSILNLPIELK